jgi:predicted RNase H-like nuclease
MFAGVDWAGNGWFAVFLKTDGFESGYYPTLWNLWRDRRYDIRRMLVDIPIGLCEDKKRACDVAAKAYIGPKLQSSLFYTPIRDAVYANNIDAGKEHHKKVDAEFSIQNQAWCLVPRIREADAFVREADRSERVLETHPEACFVALNDNEYLAHSKKTEKGIKERLNLVDDAVDIDAKAFYKEARSTFREPSYAPMIGNKDDIVDALVAAVSAASTEGELPSLPRDVKPDYDETLDRDVEIKLPTDTV